MSKNYFVSFAFYNSAHSMCLFANIEVPLPFPILGMSEIEHIQGYISQRNPDIKYVTVLNWREFECQQ